MMDAELSGPQRPELRRTRLVLTVVAFAVVAIAAPLVVGVRPGPAPSPSAVAAAPTGAPQSTSPNATPDATPAEPWEPLALEPIAAVADITPSAADEAGVRPDASFAIESLTAEPAENLASRLEVVPATAIRVAAGADARHAIVTPISPLAPGAVYRFVLRATDGSLAGSWAYRVRGPIRVLGTLPSDRTTGVPVTTGIEVIFDQEGVGDMAASFSIEPATAGRFERHDRTQVFVPAELAPATTYTVTIEAGLERTGTDLRLEDDVVFRFETAGPQSSAPRWIVGRDVLETSPSEAPVIGLTATAFEGQEAPVPTTADLKVYRFESEAEATSVLQAFLAAPRWTEYSGPTLPVADLPLAVAFKATLQSVPDPYGEDQRHWVARFPTKLDRGWYAVEVSGTRPAYAFLQITRISAWVSVLTDRTILWVNDVVSHGPVAGATAALPGKAVLGTSGADGILNARTPAALLPAAVAEGAVAPVAPIVVVHAGQDALLVAFDAASDDGLYRGEWWENWNSGDETYWSLLFTDRWQYRATDTVATWGYLRGRDAQGVPASVDVRIVSQTSSNLVDAPALASAHVEPDARGVFSVRLRFDRANLGGYEVVAVVDGRIVASRAIDVTILRKPEYQLSITTDHRAVIAGTTVALSAAASFFDGTPAPGIPLRLEATDTDFGPTDANGVATTDWVARVSEGEEEARDQYLGVSPANPESGDIYANGNVLLFPASAQLDATGSVADDRLHVTATLRAVDLAAVERRLVDGGEWDGDPGGKAIAGRSVSVSITQLVPVKTKIGTRYDFIEKIVVPIYSYDISRKALATTAIVSGADGRLVLDTAIPAPKDQYEVRFSTKDAKGRDVVRTIVVGTATDDTWSDEVTFALQHDEARYSVGDEIAWTMTTNGRTLPASAPNHYLYIVAQRGLVTVKTSDSPTFTRTFAAADAPGVFVIGVRFTGTTYAPKAASWADLDIGSRRIGVTVTADRERYRPGDDITLRVRTVDDAGNPLAADVMLQAVDEKLYAMGAAYTPDPLRELYRRVDSGIVRLTSTHQVPTASGGEGEGGDAGGGGPRTDFRDMLAFVRLRTNADGIATTTVRASDDLTSWHISASALTAGLQAGVGELLVPVGLPLFASVTVADEYLLTDHPAVRMRSFGLDLRAGDAVVFTVSSPTLGLAATSVSSTAFAGTWVDLPALKLGRHSLDVGVVAPNRKGADGKALSDRLIVTFDVVDSRLTVPRTGYGEVGGNLPSVPATVPATYTFTDAGRGRYLPLLEDLVASTSSRLDRGLAATMARSMLEDAFGRDRATLPPDPFDPTRYPIQGPIGSASGDVIEDWQRVGIALLPYGGTDPWLATRVAIADPGSSTAGDLRSLLEAIRDDSSLPRDLRIAAVAGLASLGVPVFSDVAAHLAEPNRTTFETIHLGLAAAALGDDATARSIERALLAANGQRLGPWVRLNAATSRDDVAAMTALLALLAARVGDPLAPAMLDYVRAHPSTETSHALEAAATISALLDRTPASAISFAYTIDGKRTVVALQPGDALTIALTGPQRATLTLESLQGDVGVAVAWRELSDVGSLTQDSTIGLTRTAPASVPSDRLVTVDLRATFTAGALDSGCYAVVDQVPSGLIPLAGSVIEEADPTIIWPSEVVGQRVTFCVPHDARTNPLAVSMRYLARVVSTGSFAWEPAIMTIDGIPEVLTVSGTSVVRIDE